MTICRYQLRVLLLCLWVVTIATKPLFAEEQTVVAPELELAGCVGSDVPRLAELRGRTVVLYFWATYCPDCWTWNFWLNSIQKEFESADPPFRGLVIGVASNSAPIVQGYIQKEANDASLTHPSKKFPVCIDKGGRTFANYNIEGTPTLIVISPEGTQTYFKLGYDFLSLRAAVNAVKRDQAKQIQLEGPENDRRWYVPDKQSGAFLELMKARNERPADRVAYDRTQFWTFTHSEPYGALFINDRQWLGGRVAGSACHRLATQGPESFETFFKLFNDYFWKNRPESDSWSGDEKVRSSNNGYLAGILRCLLSSIHEGQVPDYLLSVSGEAIARLELVDEQDDEIESIAKALGRAIVGLSERCVESPRDQQFAMLQERARRVVQSRLDLSNGSLQAIQFRETLYEIDHLQQVNWREFYLLDNTLHAYPESLAYQLYLATKEGAEAEAREAVDAYLLVLDRVVEAAFSGRPVSNALEGWIDSDANQSLKNFFLAINQFVVPATQSSSETSTARLADVEMFLQAASSLLKYEPYSFGAELYSVRILNHRQLKKFLTPEAQARVAEWIVQRFIAYEGTDWSLVKEWFFFFDVRYPELVLSRDQRQAMRKRIDSFPAEVTGPCRREIVEFHQRLNPSEILQP